MNICLILSTNRTYRLAVEKKHPYSSYAPATLERLVSLLPNELDSTATVIDLNREFLPKNMTCYDLAGISTVTCGATYAYKLADTLKRLGVTVVLGGSHPTACPDEAQEHAHSVVVGYGETSWPQLIRDFASGKLKKRYTDFANPFTSRHIPFNRKIHKGKGYFFNRCIEYSRGCPNACDFCVVSCINKNTIYTKSTKDTMKDAAACGKSVLFLDSNFTENLKHNKELQEALKKAKIRWYASSTLKFSADPGSVTMAAACGCGGLLIGFESINTGSLQMSNKTFNSPSHYREIIKRLHDHGMRILGCFVFGLEDDGPGIFERTVDFVQKSRVDIVRYAIATPFPGTRFYQQIKEQNRFIETDWELYDTEHVVFRPRKMTPRQLREGYYNAYRDTYRFTSIIKRLSEKFSLITFFANLGFRNIAYTL
ncbi:MAG: cobalamin-dependent protein [Spirochaetales bacterium]|nr:cobalamin-dependent protein [Spirochaetales bacterium]